MKELQNIVNKHFEKLRNKKKYLAVVTALSMLVSFMVPLILTEPADSMTYKKVTLLSDENTTEKIPVTNLGINISGDDKNMVSNAAGESGNIANGVTYAPKEMDVLALLFGGTVDEDGVLKLQDIYEGCKTVDDALEVDKETYFLGFASDFCAFIEGDFTATDADAEGRVAVGGNLRFDWDDRKWNYQIGSGDYEVMSPLDEVKWTDDYRNVYGFASALVGGQMFRINTLSTGNSANNKESGRHLNSKGDTAYYGPDEGLFKYFLVAGGTESFLHYDEDVGADKAYNNACTHDFPGSCSLCSSADPEHGYLENVNELAQMYVYKDVREIIKETFVYVRSRSETLSSMKGIKALVTVNEFQDDGSTPKNYKVIFDAASASKNDKTVYFDLDHWDDNYVKFEFVNIPEGANIVINCGEEGTVNISSDGNGGGKGDLVTSINGVVISKQGLSDEEYKNAGNWNNHPDSARLLYNFYNTTEVNIDGCFNGTVLAPYADAYSNKDKCSGHLSGALIAKSFYGGLEFGYRPYRGSSEIFSTTSGYEVPVHKLFSGSSNDPLSGAMFEIVELDSVVGANILSLFESSKYGNFVSLPTHIDYSGNTYYIAESVQNIAVNKEKVTVELNDQNHQLQGDYNVLAYKDGNYVDVIGTDAIPLQGKFYIKASQNVTLSDFNGVAASVTEGSDRYEVTLSKPITSTDYTVSLKVSNTSSQDKVITVKFIPMELKLANNSVEVGNQINFWLDKYPTDGAQFKYYYSKDNGDYAEIPDMYGASGNFTPNESGRYTIKAVASYNGVPIAEAVSAEIEVKEKQAQEVHNPYISVNNENPSKGSNIVLEVKDLPEGASTPQWTINDQFVNGGSTCNYTIPSGGTYTIKATYTYNGNTYDIYKSIRAYEPQIWVSKDTVTQSELFDFNVYDLPNGVSVTKWTFNGLAVAENTNSGSCTPELVGTFELAAELSDGSRISKWINVNQKIDNIDTSNMEITATSAYGSNFYRGVRITFGVNNAPSGANINYKLDYYGNDISGYMQNNTLTSASAGTIVVSATVNGQAVPQTKTISIVDFKLNIDPPEHRINSNVTLNVVYADDTSVPSDVISSVQFYIDNSDNEMSDYHLCSGNGSSFTAAQQGTYKIKAVINMTAGGTAEVTNSMITHSSEWNPDNSVSSTAMTFNAESDIDALAIEPNYSNDDGKGKITITYPDVGDNNYEQYLSRVRLNIPYVQNDYSIKATIRSKDSNEIKEMYLSRDQIQNQNMYWAEFTFAYDEKVIEVVIEAVTGNPIVTGYQISNYVQRFNVEKTYPANGEIATNKSYVLTFDSEVVPLEDFTLYFLKNSVKFNISFIDEAGNKLSYNNGNTAPWTTENGTFVFSEKNIAFDNGKSIADVAKVVVSAVTDDSDESNDEFKVSHYTIKTTKDEEVTPNGIDAAIEEHTYIIRESKAPNGFVKTDANYKVVVKETIHLDEGNIINNVYPKKSKAEITIYKSAANASFTTDEDYSAADKYESEPIFTTTLDILNDYDSNIRTIQYSDGTIFEITRGQDDATKDIVQSVKLNGNEVSREDIADLNKPQEFKIGEKRYYYNPATAMVVELFNENLNYYNVSGLNFQKMDDIGIPVKGAEIVLKKKTDGAFVEVGAPLWEWSNKSVEATIDIYQLDVGTIYGFFEGDPPEGYEKSAPIYFKVIETDGKRTVRYSMSEDDLSNESCDTLDMVDNRTIVMTDDRILGAKLNLKKVDENKNFLDGARFSLYADDGTETLIKSGISPITGDGIYVDLTKDVEQHIGNYVENGYLKPGRYFLIETKVPNEYKDPGAIRFTVGPDYSIILGGEGGKAYINKITSIGVSGNSLVINGNIVMDEPFGHESAPELGFGNVSSMKVVFKDGATVDQIWIDSGTGSGSDMTYGNSGRIDKYNPDTKEFFITFDTPRDIYQFKVYGSNIEFTAVEITDSEGNVLKYPPENTGTEDTDDTNSAIKDFTVQNLKDDGCTNIPIEKIWLNDSSFAAFREPIEITLYRTTTPITDYNNLPTDREIAKDKDGNNVTVTLNAENNWKYTFTDVDAKDDSGNPYYFYMVEGTCTGYKAPVYGKKVDGTLTVKNELDSVNVPVKKKLDLKNNIGTDKPESIVLRLQINNNGEWVDVEGKTITVSAATDWSGIITGLLRGKQYRLVENAVVGWEIDTTRIDVISITTNSSDPIVDTGDYKNYTDDDPDFLELINVEKIPPRGSIQLDKVWDVTGGTDADIPSSIYFKLYRVAKKFYPKQTAAEVQEDYARLLQYSLYFYDANMCGTDVAEKSALSWRGSCHTNDEIKGGFHDAGDHVMFGLPQGYSASMLGWSYYEFKQAYENLNQTAHYKTISEYYCDFFVQCIRTNTNNGNTEILVQKGAGNPDHQYWGSPEAQESQDSRMDPVTLNAVRGDQPTISFDNEMFWVSGSGADIASEYAAALALAYLNFNDGSTKYQNYLNKAKELFEYAISNESAFNQIGINIDETADPSIQHPGFYRSESYSDDVALAAAWLYLAVKKSGVTDETALKKYLDKTTDTGSIWGFSWNDVGTAAVVAKAHATGDWGKALEYANSYANKGTSSFFIQDAWGSARYNAIAQLVTLAVAKNITSQKDKDHLVNWAESQMSMILGNNNWGLNGSPVCLVTGFAENSARNAHHRAASGWATLDEYKVNSTYDSDGRIIIGALVGGPSGKAHNEEQMIKYGHTNLLNDAEHGKYLDDLHDYCCNEVSLDYNAGLVGAAAGLYYFLGTGHTYEIPGVEVQYLQSEDEEADPVNMFSTFSVRLGSGISALAGETLVLDGSDSMPYEATFSSISNVTRIEIEFEGATAYNGFYTFVSGQSYGDNYNSDSCVNNVYTISSGIPNSISCIRIGSHYSNTNSVKVKEVRIWAGSAPTPTTPTLKINNSDSASANVNEWIGFTRNPSDATITYTNNASGNQEGLEFDWTNNRVKGVTAGTYTITATYNGQTASVALTVKPTLSINDTLINKDNNETAKLTVNPNNSPSFNYDTSGLQIDNDGNVTGLKAGTYTITATVNGVTSDSVSITVTENGQGEDPPATLTLGIDRNLIKVDESVNLIPSESVNYKNYDGNIVEIVNNSQVKGKKAGSTTITAYTSDNREVSITVYVVSLNKPATSINVGGNTQWSIDGLPNGASVVWEAYNNNGVINLNNGQIIGNSAGNANVRATVTYNDQTVVFEDSIAVTDNSSGGEEPSEPDEPDEPDDPDEPIVTWNDGNTVISNAGTIGNGKLEFPLSKYLPEGAVLKEVTVTVKPANGNNEVWWDGALMLKAGDNDNVNIWAQANYQTNVKSDGTSIFTYAEDTPVSLSDCFKFGIWGGGPVSVEQIIFEYEIPPAVTGPSSMMAELTEEFTAVGMGNDITWSYKLNGGASVPIDGNEKTCNFTPDQAGSYVITATSTNDTTKTASLEFKVSPYELQFNDGSTEKTFNYHNGVPFEILFNHNENVTIEWDSDYANYLTVNDRNVTVINANAAHDVKFVATSTYLGTPTTVKGTIHIVPDLKVSNDIMTYTGRKFYLTADNAIGDLTWDVDDGGTGTVLSKDGNYLIIGDTPGIVKITVTDSQMTSAVFELKVEQGCAEVDPEIANSANDITNEIFGTNVIELNADNEWSISIDKLNLFTNDNDYYAYYLVECDEYGNLITSDDRYIQGSNGALFVPLSYEGNGTILTENESTPIKATNKFDKRVQGEMPSTGGDGTTTYYSFGAIIMLLSAAGFIGLKRRQRSQRSE